MGHYDEQRAAIAEGFASVAEGIAPRAAKAVLTECTTEEGKLETNVALFVSLRIGRDLVKRSSIGNTDAAKVLYAKLERLCQEVIAAEVDTVLQQRSSSE